MGISRKPRLFEEKGRTLFETLLIIIFVSFLMLIAADRYINSVKSVRETALMIELSNLRNAVTYYTMFNKRLPASLKELVKENIVITEKDIEGAEFKIAVLGKYVESMTTDSEGNPTDPFGNRFEFDAKTGRVRSTTGGYENW